MTVISEYSNNIYYDYLIFNEVTKSKQIIQFQFAKDMAPMNSNLKFGQMFTTTCGSAESLACAY